MAAVGALGRAQQMNLGPHDIGGQGCWACHAPATDVSGQMQWASSSKTTANVTPERDDAFFHSYRCLSCHDGSIAQVMDLGLAAPSSRPKASGPHPVNVRYAVDSDELFPVAQMAGEWRLVNNPENPLTKLKLFPHNASDPTPTVQCTSCHDPHNDGGGFFLRDPYDRYSAGTKFCRTCHAGESNYQFANLR